MGLIESLLALLIVVIIVFAIIDYLKLPPDTARIVGLVFALIFLLFLLRMVFPMLGNF
jgi:hypothetical protein